MSLTAVTCASDVERRIASRKRDVFSSSSFPLFRYGRTQCQPAMR